MSIRKGEIIVKRQGETIPCSAPDCTESVPNHYWGKVREGAEWFFQKNGDAWCPDHHPDWVAEWRSSNKEPK